jgi:hypothetical protein
LTPERIAVALQERELFLEIDQLSDVEIATEDDPWQCFAIFKKETKLTD